METVTLNGDNFEHDYIGCWFPQEYMPQRIFIQIDPEHEPVIEYNPETSNAVPSRVWHGLAIRIYLPSYVYSQDEADYILKALEKDIQAIEDSYEEKYRDGTYWGSFDDSLIEELQEKVIKYTSELEIDQV